MAGELAAEPKDRFDLKQIMKLKIFAWVALALGAAGAWTFAEHQAQDTVAETVAEPASGNQAALALLASKETLAALEELSGDDRDAAVLATLRDIGATIEIQNRRYSELIEEVAALRVELTELTNNPDRQPAIAALTEMPDASAITHRRSGRFGRNVPDEPREDRLQRLVDAGFRPANADAIVTAVDEVSMQRIELLYKAAREGWANTTEYRTALRELPDARELVREEYGEDGYDRYLYATGRPNRVVVNSVLANAPAAAAGLQPGDTLIDFAGERVYNSRDLIRIATQGDAQELVPLRVDRGGNVLEVYVQRGPLGINTRSTLEKPPQS
ncbi:MAG: PDZ domain-containing protein [Gammaproteobacteria bacterium]|nr:PDZ domain-containing protein [Gammaproteobacteria bacterium]